MLPESSDMINLRNIPIKRKLISIIMLISTIVLVLMSSAYIVFEYNSNRAAAKKNLSTLGVVIASNSSAALAFDSRQDAAEILEAFKADEHIIAACLYDKNGDIFA